MAAIRRMLIMVFLAAVGLAACAPIYRNHGFVPPDDALALVEVGKTTADELPTLIGRPSTQGLLTGAAWYYVGSRWLLYGAQEPKEVSREVVAISFGPDGRVSNVERFGLERGRVVTLSRRVTETGISEVSLVRQILGNVGNVRAGDFIE